MDKIIKKNSSYHDDTELRLGLPGTNDKERSFFKINQKSTSSIEECHELSLSSPQK